MKTYGGVEVGPTTTHSQTSREIESHVLLYARIVLSPGKEPT